MSFRPASEVGFTTATTRFVAPGSVTNGEFGLFEWRMEARRPGARPHFHKTFSESFYVLEGEITLLDGEEWVTAGEGDFLYVPSHRPHAFRNDSDAPVRMLILFSPGIAREDFFLEVRDAKNLSPDELRAFYERHDQYNL
ncbi:cupin domain-containing protein [Lentzea sp. BCCO 10_0798]|uniref:Cupin domain-containing protein n=1 Tax=Lentzea kristufekii TaxID=3095430 RepID=A0ABU4U2I9_9PSEU|nr:cupin domain-containing protein [Lentzea sp. BCCO 10_0798]MDX8054716.1 cupin domain-containing protein [Lentzea sp. BCCO 10_0798]